MYFQWRKSFFTLCSIYTNSLGCSHSLPGTWRTCFRRPMVSIIFGKPAGWWGKPDLGFFVEDKTRETLKVWVKDSGRSSTPWEDPVEHSSQELNEDKEGCCCSPKCSTEYNCSSFTYNLVSLFSLCFFNCGEISACDRLAAGLWKWCMYDQTWAGSQTKGSQAHWEKRCRGLLMCTEQRGKKYFNTQRNPIKLGWCESIRKYEARRRVNKAILLRHFTLEYMNVYDSMEIVTGFWCLHWRHKKKSQN